MFDLITTPYPLSEAVGMIRRRFSPPPPRPRRAPMQRMQITPDLAPDVWIGFVGDISPLQGRQIRYDPEVHSFFADCAHIIGNLEGVVTDRPWFPYLHNHTCRIFDVLEELKPLNRWVLSIANNHALDYGPRALLRTVDECARRDVAWFGTHDRPRVRLSRDITVTGWTWWVNRRGDGVARNDPGGLSDEGLHVAYPHWGYEHEREPRRVQRQRLPRGYDVIVGHHSHLPQPVELHEGQRPVAWSLGNFMTSKCLPVLGEGILVKIAVAYSDRRPVIAELRSLDIEIERPLRGDYCAVIPRGYP